MMISFLKFMMTREGNDEKLIMISDFLKSNAPNKEFVVGMLSKKVVIFYNPSNIELQTYLSNKGLYLHEDYATA